MTIRKQVGGESMKRKEEQAKKTDERVRKEQEAKELALIQLHEKLEKKRQGFYFFLFFLFFLFFSS